MRLELLAPANLLCLLAVVPIAAVMLQVQRRSRRAAVALGLQRERWPAAAASFAVTAGAVSLLVLAASKPVAWKDDGITARTDAQAYVLVDTSLSMLARPSVETPPRIAVARRLVARLVHRMPQDLPVGLAVMPQSLLPVLAPTVDRRVLLDTAGWVLFAGRLPTRAVGTAVPPGAAATGSSAATLQQAPSSIATSFTALGTLALAPFYAPSSRKRLAILVTDGESTRFDSDGVAERLRRARIDLLVLRVGGTHDRLWRRVHGRRTLDLNYRPAQAGVPALTSLTSSLGGRGLYREDDLSELVDRARGLVGKGPTRRVGARSEPVALGRYFAASSLPLLAFAVAPLLPAAPRPRRREQSGTAA